VTSFPKCILEPLCFPERPACSCSAVGVQSGGAELLVCLFCSESVPTQQKDALLRHLLLEHKLVIADVKLIADLAKYLLYWKGRFMEQSLTDFCSVIKTNSTGPVEKQEEYFLLCDVLPEDRLFREKLQQKRLEEVLEQQSPFTHSRFYFLHQNDFRQSILKPSYRLPSPPPAALHHRFHSNCFYILQLYKYMDIYFLNCTGGKCSCCSATNTDIKTNASIKM
uniref:Zinc finger protein 277 n=1 Tax=Salarias fasciatus TaxID=181472 RepID=A0A672JKM7_SALFA